MSEENKNITHRGIVMVITIAIAIPLLYVLSVGPAFLIGLKHPTYWRTIQEIYFPLKWLHNHTALREPLEWYLGLWLA